MSLLNGFFMFVTIILAMVLSAIIILEIYAAKYRGSLIIKPNDTDDNIINTLNRFTIRVNALKPELVESMLENWDNDLVSLYLSNLVRLSIEQGVTLRFFENCSRSQLNKTLYTLKMLNLNDLNEIISNDYNTYHHGGAPDTSVYMWYKLPLKNAMLNFIRSKANS